MFNVCVLALITWAFIDLHLYAVDSLLRFIPGVWALLETSRVCFCQQNWLLYLVPTGSSWLQLSHYVYGFRTLSPAFRLLRPLLLCWVSGRRDWDCQIDFRGEIHLGLETTGSYLRPSKLDGNFQLLGILFNSVILTHGGIRNFGTSPPYDQIAWV